MSASGPSGPLVLNYQAEDSCEEEPVEPASKRSKVRGRVTSKGRNKRRVPVAESSDSSTDSDDVPLSQVSSKTKGKGKPVKKAQKKKAPPAKKKHSKPPAKKASKPVKVSRTCLKHPLKKNTKNGFRYQLSLNAGQKYCRLLQGEHSAIL